MQFRGLIRSARLPVMLAILLFVQTAAAGHIDLDDSHGNGDACALCAGLSALDDAVVAVCQSFHFVPPFRPAFAVDNFAAVEQRSLHRFIRGPPATS